MNDLALDWFSKYSPTQPRVPAGSPHGGEFASTRGGAAVPGSRSERARLFYKPSTAEKQKIADQSEEQLSRVLKLKRTRNNSPFDLQGDKVGIEVKTLIDNKNDKITMHPESRLRKIQTAKKEKLRTYTVVVDRRASKPSYYWAKGVGSFRLRNMNKVARLEDLPGVIK